MQGMLGKVRVEMEDLQDSRKFWEDRTLNSDHEVQCLQSSVQEWKEKALTLETKANELEKELSALKGELEKLKPAQCIEQSRTVINKQNLSLAYIWKEQENHTADKECKEETARDKSAEQNSEFVPTTDSLPLSLGKQL